MKILLENIYRGNKRFAVLTMFLALGFVALPFAAQAQDQDQDDPPGRVARLGFMEGSISFQPAGEDQWVEAVRNRPMTTGDKLWADRDSRAEVQLGSATIGLGSNTGLSLLNLDDRTIQIQLSAGALNVRVWDLDRDNVFEIDTPNLAFTVSRPGRYRVEASENGDYTIVTLREGEGEATGNGQSYTMHSGQRFTFRGTESLNAEVDQIGPPDDFDRWADTRERRYEDSPSARYCSRRVVGYSDLDEYGDWQPTPDYGYVWFPRVEVGWAPYHYGHWAWIDPWGWTWVDDAPWGYAPFHYGRWSYWHNRWGWVPGPREERPVYAPALVAFVGGAVIGGATVAWFPLGPREVYVPSYRVSERYVNRVNITNTTVNTTVIHNVYNTTVINNNNTTINNVTYVNRNVRGAVVAVPQRTFVGSQPVARNAVAVDASRMRATPVMARAAVPPGRESVFGPHANTAGRVAAPPQAVMSRPVIAKATPPPSSPSFAARQQVLAQHPGQAVPRAELRRMAPAHPPAAAPVVRQAPPARPATPQPAMNRPGNQPAPQPGANARPGNPPAAQPQPAPAPGAGNRPFTPPGRNDRTPSAQPNNRPEPPARNERPEPNQPAPGRPQPNAAQPAQPQPGVNNRPFTPPGRNDRPPTAQPNYRPMPNEPNNRPQPSAQPPARNERPESAQPNNRPEPNQPPPNRPPARNDRPESAQPNDRPEPNQPPPNRPPARNDRPESAQPNNRPEPNRAEPNVPRANQPMPDARPTPSPRSEPTPDARPVAPPRAEPNRPPAAQPQYQPPPRAQTPPPQERPQARPAPEPRPSQPPQRESRPAPPERQQSRPAPEQKNRPEDPNKKPQ